jgi:hypothetical protein
MHPSKTLTWYLLAQGSALLDLRESLAGCGGMLLSSFSLHLPTGLLLRLAADSDHVFSNPACPRPSKVGASPTVRSMQQCTASNKNSPPY